MSNTDESAPADKYPHAEIGERLRAIRMSTGLNLKDFAAYCGLNYTRYINWEKGTRRLLPDEAIYFCDKFGVTLDFIYRGNEAQLPQKILNALVSKSRDSA